MKRIILFAFIHLFTILPIFSSAQVIEQDSLELINFYNSTDGANWTKNYQWVSSYPIYLWYGVVRTDDRVIRIELGDNNLSGPIPSTIETLSALTSLILSKNSLTGGIPTSIGNLKKLEYLYL